MKTLRNIALTAAAAGALALASTVSAQEEKKPEGAAKPESSHQHRGAQHGQHGQRGMGPMGAMGAMGAMGGGCHGQSQGESAEQHKHS